MWSRIYNQKVSCLPPSCLLAQVHRVSVSPTPECAVLSCANEPEPLGPAHRCDSGEWVPSPGAAVVGVTMHMSCKQIIFVFAYSLSFVFHVSFIFCMILVWRPCYAVLFKINGRSVSMTFGKAARRPTASHAERARPSATGLG